MSVDDSFSSSNTDRSPYAPRFSKSTERGAKRVLKPGALAQGRKKAKVVNTCQEERDNLIQQHILLQESHLISDSLVTRIDEQLFSCVRTVLAGRHFFLDKSEFTKAQVPCISH